MVLRVMPLLAALSICTVAQTQTGTIDVIYVSSAKAVVAADSRVTTYLIDGSKVHRDVACKIGNLGNRALFTASGVEGHGEPGHPGRYMMGWSVLDEAIRSYATNGPRLEPVMSKWAENVKQKFNMLAKNDPSFLQTQAGETGRISNAVFITGDNPVVATEYVFSYSPSQPSPVSYQRVTLNCDRVPIGPFCGIGETDVLAEFAMLVTPRAQRENSDWQQQRSSRTGMDDDAQRAIRLVDLTIAYDRTNGVGGPIDAAMLKDGKVKWLQRKDNCPP